MPVASLREELFPARRGGVELGWAEAGIRKANRKDVLVVRIAAGASVGGVFTRNRFCAAPVTVCREHLAAGAGIRALVVNTGNANAGTGEAGLRVARTTCEALAKLLGCEAAQVLPFSTGVIMEPLPVDRLVAGLPAAIDRLGPGHWLEAAEAIMTTDTQPKAVSRRVDLGGRSITVTGIAKGAGMIRPNMATMLGFVATDAAIAPALMPQLTRMAADRSFNRITIDGDTSTNDSFVVDCQRPGRSAARSTRRASPAYAAVAGAIEAVALQLAQAIVRDGEGATKFIEVRVGAGAHAKKRRPASPTPSRTRRWSRPRSSRPIPISAASSRRSAMPGSTTSTRAWSRCTSTTSGSSATAAAAPSTVKRTGSAS